MGSTRSILTLGVCSCTFFLVDECPWRGRRQDLRAHSVYCSRIHKRLDYLEKACAEERRLRKVAEEHAATFAIQASRESYADAISSEDAEEGASWLLQLGT